MIDYTRCPACDHKRGLRPIDGSITIRTCPKCGAIFGQCYLGESYEIVLPYMHPDPPPPEECRYFDFLTIGSRGIDRRHGWYDPRTKLITQIG